MKLLAPKQEILALGPAAGSGGRRDEDSLLRRRPFHLYKKKLRNEWCFNITTFVLQMN